MTSIVRKKQLACLFFIPFLMFGFGYLMVPIYNVICDLSGLNGKINGITLNVKDINLDKERFITVEFVGSINQNAPWKFWPKVKTIVVNPGKLYQTNFFATNTLNQEIIGQAVPSISPGKAANFLKKTECFCFNHQKFDAFESREMPLVFMIDPNLPKNIDTVTLSYTFFNISERMDQEKTNLET